MLIRSRTQLMQIALAGVCSMVASATLAQSVAESIGDGITRFDASSEALRSPLLIHSNRSVMLIPSQ
jgi:hypothetical protein